MNNKLIMDVGMHTGNDSEFYLKKGFKVVAIEANPELVREAQNYFEEDIAKKKLVIHNIAIADYYGEIDLYINDQHDDWGTVCEKFAHRNERFGTTNTKLKVSCCPFEFILEKHGIPYYLKIDIEGMDFICLKALRKFPNKPKYVSIEAGLASFDESINELTLLGELGYERFKIINQAINYKIKCPYPALEGEYIDYQFDGTCSGPFGEESPGEWLSMVETLSQYEKIIVEQKLYGADGSYYKTAQHRAYEQNKGEPVGWYDFHAKLGQS